MTHEATVRDVLSGHVLPSDRPRCGQCHARVRDGAEVVVLARKPKGAVSWSVLNVYCADHAPDPLPTTPGGESALAVGTLGSLVDTAQQTHQPALCDVVIEDCALAETEEVPA